MAGGRDVNTSEAVLPSRRKWKFLVADKRRLGPVSNGSDPFGHISVVVARDFGAKPLTTTWSPGSCVPKGLRKMEHGDDGRSNLGKRARLRCGLFVCPT